MSNTSLSARLSIQQLRLKFVYCRFGRNSFFLRFRITSSFEKIRGRSSLLIRGLSAQKQKGASSSPLFREKGAPDKSLIPRCTNQDFLLYQLVKLIRSS